MIPFPHVIFPRDRQVAYEDQGQTIFMLFENTCPCCGEELEILNCGEPDELGDPDWFEFRCTNPNCKESWYTERTGCGDWAI